MLTKQGVERGRRGAPTGRRRRGDSILRRYSPEGAGPSPDSPREDSGSVLAGLSSESAAQGNAEATRRRSGVPPELEDHRIVGGPWKDPHGAADHSPW
jgi:hypothetical protein